MDLEGHAHLSKILSCVSENSSVLPKPSEEQDARFVEVRISPGSGRLGNISVAKILNTLDQQGVLVREGYHPNVPDGKPQLRLKGLLGNSPIVCIFEDLNADNPPLRNRRQI